MKRSMFVLAIVLMAIIVGCQEGNVNDPSTNSVVQASPLFKAALPDNSDIILLLATVVDAGAGVQYSVTGQVKFGLTQLSIMREELFDVALNTQAKVKQLGLNETGWTVSNTSTERINLTRHTSATVDKWYFLQGGPNSRHLHIRFDVTATRVSVGSIVIE